MFTFLRVSYTKWKAVATALSLDHYYIQENVRYIPFVVDTTNKLVFETEVMRDITNSGGANLQDFEATIKPTATVEPSIADGIADEFIP